MFSRKGRLLVEDGCCATLDVGPHTFQLKRFGGRHAMRERVTEHHGLSIVGAAAPRAVLCLLSALEFHGLGTAVPASGWIAIDRRSRAPKLDWPPLRVFRFGGDSLTEGIAEHEAEGITLRVFSPAKTVADLFKFRNKVGLDVALEALRAVWADERATIDELVHYGRICRVDRVMRPYLEAVVS